MVSQHEGQIECRDKNLGREGEKRREVDFFFFLRGLGYDDKLLCLEKKQCIRG